MKHFKDKNNQLYAFNSDGSQDSFIREDLIAISESEKDEILEQKRLDAEDKAALIVPDKVTMRQARLALLAEGMLSGVETALNALPEPQKQAALIEWEYATSVERNGALVAAMGAALGLTGEQLDSLFKEAAKL